MDTVEIKVRILQSRGLRLKYCDEYGVSPYAVAEGLLDTEDIVQVSVDFIRNNL